MSGVKCQSVVIVKAIDLYVSQAHLIVGKNGVGIHRGNDWDQIWKEQKMCKYK